MRQILRYPDIGFGSWASYAAWHAGIILGSVMLLLYSLGVLIPYAWLALIPLAIGLLFCVGVEIGSRSYFYRWNKAVLHVPSGELLAVVLVVLMILLPSLPHAFATAVTLLVWEAWSIIGDITWARL